WKSLRFHRLSLHRRNKPLLATAINCPKSYGPICQLSIQIPLAGLYIRGVQFSHQVAVAMRIWKKTLKTATNLRSCRRRPIAKSRARAASARFRRLLFEHYESRTLLATLVNTGTAADVIYTLPATANTVFLEDDGVSGNGLLQ